MQSKAETGATETNAIPGGRQSEAQHSSWNRWLLCPLAGTLSAAALATSGAGVIPPTAATASGGAHHPAPAPANYRVIQLLPRAAATLDINAKGQVTYTDLPAETGIPRAKFYDGHTTIDIGTLGGPAAGSQAINDRGQITGSSATAGGAFHAFLWSKATGMIDIHRPGLSVSNGYVLNNKGWVAGVAPFSGASGPLTAFRWTPATGMVNIGSFGTTSFANAINDAGTVVGYSQGPEPGILGRAFKWTEAGGLQSLVSTSSVVSQANDINEAGKIVGSGTDDLAFNDRALLWTPQGTQIDLNADFTILSYAYRINEKGLVIGQTFDNIGDNRGFVWSREHGILEFGSVGTDASTAFDLNNLGQVVGSLNARAFLWTRAGGTVDLNTRVPGAPPDFVLYQADAISDNGSILASANTGLVLLVPSAAYHQAPVAAPIALSGATRVNSLLSFSSAFRDVDLRDTHQATWTWGDGTTSAGIVSQAAGSGNASGQHAYRKTGIYTVRLSILDSGGKRTAVERKVTICGCSAMVAGQGSFLSPANAARQAKAGVPGLAPRRGASGSFAFVADAGSKRPGAGSDHAAVEVSVAGLALRSTAIDTLAVNDNRVQLSGVGTVNGKANYRFTLSTVAGSKRGDKDRVRVRIAHVDPGTKAEVVDYDNGASPAADAVQGRTGGGSLHAEGSVILGGSLSLSQSQSQ